MSVAILSIIPTSTVLREGRRCVSTSMAWGAGRGRGRKVGGSRGHMVDTRSIIYEQQDDPVQVVKGHKYKQPAPGDGQVLLKVALASINPADLNVIKGVYPTLPSPRKLPDLDKDVYVGGNEGFAVVQQDSAILKKGDWVSFTKPQIGTWTSHIICEEKDVIKIERRSADSLSPVMASTLQVNPATAYRMLHDFQTLEKGDIIIQNAANSAVGQAVIQIAARKMGVETINLVRNRPDLHKLKSTVEKWGTKDAPAHLFTYEEVEEAVKNRKSKGAIDEIVAGRKVKLGLNAVCGTPNSHMTKYLSSRSTLVTYGSMSLQPFSIPASLLIFKDATMKGFMMNRWYATHSLEERKKMLREIITMYEDGVLEPPPSVFADIGEEDRADEITRKARAAIENCTKEHVGHKHFFRF